MAEVIIYNASVIKSSLFIILLQKLSHILLHTDAI